MKTTELPQHILLQIEELAFTYFARYFRRPTVAVVGAIVHASLLSYLAETVGLLPGGSCQVPTQVGLLLLVLDCTDAARIEVFG